MSELQIAIENESFQPAKCQLFFDYTVNHFNSTNRGVGDIQQCSYKNGCAIGIHLDKPLQTLLDDIGQGYVKEHEIFTRLPEWMQSLGLDFLSNMQELHDRKHNWDEDGLTDSGKYNANMIATKFCY